MALWGNNDAIASGGTLALNYGTGVVTGTATTFGNVGSAQVGDVIRFGQRSGTYFGDAVILSIESTTSLTIGSTAGLSGAAISGAQYSVSQLPKSTILDSRFSEASYGVDDTFVYGVDEAGTESSTTYKLTHGGWVGITTYNDSSGEMRVKTETLVAMSGITTGNPPVFPPAA